MRVFKNMFQAKKDLAVAEETLAEAAELLKAVNTALNDATRMRFELMAENEDLFDELAAERAQKERYRTAFLDRMNVPVTGKAWTGGDGFLNER